MAGGSESETDIWECRFRELENVPNLHHVIVEAEVTHRGDPKPLWFREYGERFKPWGSGSPTFTCPRTCSRLRRKTRTRGAGSMRSGSSAAPAWTKRSRVTSCLHGDADEIPRPGAITATEDLPLLVSVLQMRLCMYAVDWLHPLAVAWDDPHPLPVSRIVRAAAGHAEPAPGHHGRRVAPVVDGRHRSAPRQARHPLSTWR